MRAEDQFHVGVVVENFEAALADLSEQVTQPALERSWAEPAGGTGR